MNKFDGPHVVRGSQVNKFEQVLGSQVDKFETLPERETPCKQTDWVQIPQEILQEFWFLNFFVA